MELVIEVITRSGKVLSLHKFDGNRVTLGRAYDNDLILQEEHVCPYHAEVFLDETGQLVLQDNTSVNGIKDHFNRHLGQTVEVESGDVFVLGKHYVRIFRSDHPVQAAKKINVFEDTARFVNHWYWALISVLAFYGLALVSEYFETIKEIKWSGMAVKILVATLMFALIPLLVAIAARVFKKDVKFFSIFAFFFALLTIWLILAMFGSILVFNWGDAVLVAVGSQLIDYGLAFVFIWGAFYLSSNLNLKKITVTASSLTALLFIILHIDDLTNDEVRTFPSYQAKMLPQSFMISTPNDVPTYLTKTDELFSTAESEALKRNIEAKQDE